jgi:undecaprenyl diphosphate synthase
MEETANLPVHIAFILDGNGRWAAKRDLPRLVGHRAGIENIHPVLEHLQELGVRFVTLYVFSTENWNRPAEEVNGLFSLLEKIIPGEARELHKHGVKIRHIGSIEGISRGLLQSITGAILLTAGNTGMTLNFAFNYGGRAEILEAVRKLVAAGEPVDSLNEKTFDKYLYTAGVPDVDLVIRTGGEIRTSNFLIWQSAYAEYYFTPVLWPDFNAEELDKALEAYRGRKRRFGGI